MSLADAVYEQLVDDVLEGRWTAGGTVSAYALARRLAVSRTPVVEALKRLEAEGLVEIQPRVGARLRESTPEGRAELYSILEALLGLAAERAAARVEEESLSRMDALVTALVDTARRQDISAYRRAAGEFYEEVIRAGLPAHAVAAQQFWRVVRAGGRRELSAQIRPEAAEEAGLLVEALRAGSPARARAAVERHVSGAAAWVGAEVSPSIGGGLEHLALLYRSRAEFMASALPFALAGLQRDEPLLVVSSPENIEALASALDGRGSRLEFRESESWYDHPAGVLKRWRDHVQRRESSPRARVIAEPRWSGCSDRAAEDWLRYESILNVALESEPISILCPYDVEHLPAHIVRGARAGHPHVCEFGQTAPSPQYRAVFTSSPA